MKITVLNGNPWISAFDQLLAELRERLIAKGHRVTLLNLRALPLRYCTGCFECWTKNPGLCEADLASQEMGRAVINSDFTLWAAPLRMGFPSAILKMALDKHLPLIHPYMEVDQGEAHHIKRYESYPRVGLLVEKEPDTRPADLELLTAIFSRTALNFKSKLEFLATTEMGLAELVSRIERPRQGPHLYPRNPGIIRGAKVDPPRSLTVFNGSPRGRKGNTSLMLEEFSKGFGEQATLHHLIFTRELEQQLKAFREAECVWLGFPLYADGMPGLVKAFIEALEPLRGRKGNPPIGFLVQSGFPEGIHSRYLERYLQRLASLLGAPYLGTIIKGNGEGTRLRSEDANQRLFQTLRQLGGGLREKGCLENKALAALAKPERFPRVLEPFFRVFLRTRIAHSYFDSMLAENDAAQLRDARPLLESD